MTPIEHHRAAMRAFHLSLAVMFILGLLAGVMFSISFARADSVPMIDDLGGARDCNALIEALPKGWGAGMFFKEFGPALPCFRDLAKTGKPSILRTQALWRSSHVYGAAEEKEALSIAPAWFDIARQFPAIEWQFSPFCEHNRNLRDMQGTFKKLRALNPPANVRLVNSPWRGAIMPGERNELHGKGFRIPPGEYQTSLDGTRASNINMRKWVKDNQGARVIAVWDLLNNCNQQDQPKIDPKKRPVCADANYLRAQVAMLQNALIPAPKFSFPVKQLSGLQLYKIFGEDKFGKSDPRENRPATLTPFKSDMISVKASNGKEVAKFKRFPGDFAPGVSRHYSGTGSKLYGYEIAERAIRAAGSPFIALCDGRSCLGPINSAIREGYEYGSR